MNTYLKYQPSAVQFLSFLSLAGAFIILDGFISSHFFADITRVILDERAVVSDAMLLQFKFGLLVSAIVSFILPSVLFGYFSSPDMLPYLGIQKTISPFIILLCVVLLITFQPFVGWLGEMNSRINFGKFQKALQQTEAIYNRLFKVLLQMKTSGDVILNLVIMALIPAIGEELFFRGSLQKVLLRLSQKPWLAIIVTSVIFALLHGTYFKIIPIFTLGLLLGIVYYYTRNLWYTIIIHFANNALAVLATYFSNKSKLLKDLTNDNINVPLYGALVSLIIAVGIIFLIKRKSDEVLPAPTNEDNDFIA